MYRNSMLKGGLYVNIQKELSKGSSSLLVLSVLGTGDMYGYQIIKDLSGSVALSESTLYPVLRRLQKDECLEVYDRECSGRTRRYYKVTSRGWAQLHLYESEWRSYSDKITGLFEGKLSDRSEA